MNKVDRKKTLATMESYDEKIRKAQEELQRISDRRENFYMTTVANTLKSNNISLPIFFDYIDVIIEDLKTKSKKTENRLREMDKAVLKENNSSEKNTNI